MPSTLLNTSVPPTATAYGDDAGYSTIGTPPTPPLGGTPAAPQYPPVSPVDAKSVCPCAAASTRIMSPTSMSPDWYGNTSQPPTDAFMIGARSSLAHLLNATVMSVNVNDATS